MILLCCQQFVTGELFSSDIFPVIRYTLNNSIPRQNVIDCEFEFLFTYLFIYLFIYLINYLFIYLFTFFLFTSLFKILKIFTMSQTFARKGDEVIKMLNYN